MCRVLFIGAKRLEFMFWNLDLIFELIGLYQVLFYLSVKGMEQPEYVMEKTKSGQGLKESELTKAGSVSSDEQQYEDEADFSFSSLNSQVTVDLVSSTPQTVHLIVGPGLNIKARCQNKNCTANKFKNHSCWIKKGFGIFDISVERYKSKCVCGTRVKPDSVTTIGFTQASILVTGLKIVDDQGVDFNQTFTESEGKFKYFDDIDSSMSMWAKLHIEAKQA